MDHLINTFKKKGDGLEDINERIFSELERIQINEGKEYPGIKEKLLKLQGIVQEILAESKASFLEEDDNQHKQIARLIKYQIYVYYIFSLTEDENILYEKFVCALIIFQAQASSLLTDIVELIYTKPPFWANTTIMTLANTLEKSLALTLVEAQAYNGESLIANFLGQANTKAKTLIEAIEKTKDFAKEEVEAEVEAEAFAKEKAEAIVKALKENLTQAGPEIKTETVAQAFANAMDGFELKSEENVVKAFAEAFTEAFTENRTITEAMHNSLGPASLDLFLNLFKFKVRNNILDKAAADLLAMNHSALETEVNVLISFLSKAISQLLFEEVGNKNWSQKFQEFLKEEVILDFYFELLNTYFRNRNLNPGLPLFEQILDHYLDILENWQSLNIFEEVLIKLDELPPILKYEDDSEEAEFKTSQDIALEVKEPLAPYKPITSFPQFEAESEWSIQITIPGDFHRASDVSNLVLYFSEGLQTIPGVEVEFAGTRKGSLVIMLIARFKNLMAKEGTKEVLKEFEKETKRIAPKAIKSLEDKYLSKPIEDVKNLKANTTKVERDTLSEEQAEERNKLQLAMMREDLIKKRLENIKAAGELMKEGLLPIKDLQIDVNEVLLLKKSNDQIEFNENWEEEVE